MTAKRRTAANSVPYFNLVTANHSCPHCPSTHEWLSLTLAKNSAQLYVSDEVDTQLLGIAVQIEAFPRSKRSFVSYAASLWASYTILLTFNIVTWAFDLPRVIYLLRYGFHGTSLHFAGVLDVLGIALLGVIVLSYFIWATYTYNRRHCIVYLDERSAMPGFIRRNQDQIIVAIISAVIGAVVGAVVTVLLASLLQ